MRNSLYIIGLAIGLTSCESQKPVQKIATNPKLSQKTTPKPAVKAKPAAPQSQVTREHGVDFFRTNIADPTKKDNTISYGSIVSANPVPYKVVKTYFPAVAQNFRQKYIILHYTALDNDKSVSVLTSQSVSAHYLVNDMPDNEVYQLVDENKRAYHAGISSWRGAQNLNDTSLGIEIVNLAQDAPGGGFIFPDFPDYQVKKIAALVKDLATRYQISPVNILAHADIAPTRKQDPGPKFPWKKLYTDYQIGMWYDDATMQNFLAQTPPESLAEQMTSSSFIYKVQVMFREFGYGIEPSGTWDEATKKTITAFQYHFRPVNYSGVLDAETYAILQALLQKYPK